MSSSTPTPHDSCAAHDDLHPPVVHPAATVSRRVGDRRVGDRRVVVSAITLVIGGSVLAWSLRIPAGEPLFYPATLLLALVWVVGARLSGPLPLGRGNFRAGHGVGRAVLLGLALLVVFLCGAVVVSQVPPLAEPVQQLLDHARKASLLVVAVITAINGASEEVFFRGALFAALPRRWQVVASTAIYTLVTALSGVPLLVLAALMLGTVVALQRRTTRGILAPVVTHLVWSLGMLLLLGPTISAASRVLG